MLGAASKVASFIFLSCALTSCSDAESDEPADSGVRTADAAPADVGVSEMDASVPADGGNPGDASDPLDATSPDAGCVPTGPEICDRIDNDCNDRVDDLDRGADGIYDCLAIGLFGNSGSNGSSDFLAWLVSNGTTVVRTQTVSRVMTDAELEPYRIIILDRLIRDYTRDEARALARWVEAGGGLMSMSGYSGGSTDLTRPNTLMAELGVSYVNGLRSGPVTEFTPHATTSSITSMTFLGGFRVATSSVATSTQGVAFLADGPVGVVEERGRGRVFVWGDEWISFDSEWRGSVQVLRFWINILGWLSGLR